MCISTATLGTLLVVLLSGCAIDQRKAVAYDLMYQPDGFENASVFDAVVRARFPTRTEVKELQAFFTRMHGDCDFREDDHITCEAPTRTGLCWARLMKVNATVHESKITAISVLVGGLGC